MPDNANHTAGSFANGGPQLPLQPFFTALQQNGFSVTPEQTVQASRLIDRFSPEVANEAELCNYLSPLFARNEDEQLQFAEVFKAEFKSPAPEPLRWFETLKRHLAKYRRLYALVLGLTVVVALFVWWYLYPQPATLKRDAIQFYLKEKNSDTSKISVTGFHMMTDSLLSVRMDTSTTGGISGIRLETRYQWGDGAAMDTISKHRYTSEGIFTFYAYSTVFYNDQFQFIDTSTALVGVCRSYNTVQIAAANDKSSFVVGEKIQLRAIVTGEKPDRILWGENDDTIGYGNTFDTSYNTEGSHTIGCGAVYDSINSPCNASNSFSFTVNDPNKPIYTATIVPAANAQPVTLLYRVKPVWYKGLGIIALLAFIGAIAVAMRSNNRRRKQQHAAKETDAEYDALLQSFTGKKKPAELPFRNKNYLPVPEPELTEAAVQMRRRVQGGAFYLDIPKTIGKAIRQGGFFQPVHSPRLHQNEYLVLIDASHNNNQQVKLFDYLTDGLKKQNVFIEKYYYRYEPKQCFSATEPDGITLEKLAEKYSRHTLLIFGNAYQLLYPYYPVFDSSYSQLLSQWENKAVITPVPLPDWTDKEKAALLPNLPVVPVDVAGLLELMPVLFANEGRNMLATLQQYQSHFYGTTSIDFEDITALEKYCAEVSWANTTVNGKPENILFQWIAALTVYPRLRWEVTLAIGKTILDKYGKPEELNFTTLLRVARIQWMKDGRFPDETRLELLKRLTPENEVLVRQVMLVLLEEIPADELDETHFAWQEKEIQRITNEFILYAYDPLTYASYKRSEELYGKLLSEKKIKDVVSRLYLKNGATERWITLLSKGNGSERKLGVPVNEYFGAKNKSATSKLTPTERNLIETGLGLILISVAGLVFLFVLDLLHTNRFSTFMWKPSVQQEVRFRVQPTDSLALATNIRLSIDTTSVSVKVNDSVFLSLPLDDSLKQTMVQFDNATLLDTSLNITYDSYNISLSQHRQPENGITVTIYTDECLPDSIPYKRILNSVDNSLVVTTVASASTGSGTCDRYISCRGNVRRTEVDSIKAALQSYGINLTISELSTDHNTPGQVRIYSDLENVPVVRKPVVYIQHNDKSNDALVSRNALSNCLSKSFTTPPCQYQPTSRTFYRSEIRYYRKSFADSIPQVQACLKKNYPNKIFYPVQLSVGKMLRPASAEIWIYDDLSISDTIKSTTVLSIGYGDKIGTVATGYSVVGPIVQNNKGELFAICSAPIFPISEYKTSKIYKYENGKSWAVASESFQQSKTCPYIGLMKLSQKTADITSLSGLKGVKNALINQPVFLYMPTNSPTQSGRVQGVVTSINYSGSISGQSQSYNVFNVVSTTLKMNQELAGSLLVDKNNYALAILIASDNENSLFVSLSSILQEFNVKLAGNQISYRKAAYK